MGDKHEHESEHRSGIVHFALSNVHALVILSVTIVTLGTLAIIRLPKDLLPKANLPAVQLITIYPGMSVGSVEKSLTTRLELYTGQALGIDHQESRSLLGVSVIRNFFKPDVDLNSALAQTTSLVFSVMRQLPPGVQPPIVMPYDPSGAVPLGLIAVSGDFSESKLYDAARYEVRNAAQAVAGAMTPTVMGGAAREVVIELDPKKLTAYNLSAVEVLNRIEAMNSFVPTGDTVIGKKDLQLTSNALVDTPEHFANLDIRAENGKIIRLSDVGRAYDGAMRQTNIVSIDGKRQVYVPLYRQPGANSLQIVDDVKIALANVAKTLGGIKLTLVADQTGFVRKAIESITHEALIGGGLAALMVLLFLGDWRSTIGIALALPLSIFAAFLGLMSIGETINAMSLGGVALSIGVLIDNSIVVLENIHKKMSSSHSQAHDHEHSVFWGAAEMAKPVLASTLATLVVFLPVIFLDGMVKVLLASLAKSVTFIMIASYLVAMMIIPIYARRFIRHSDHTPFLLMLFQRGLDKLTQWYGLLLSRVIGTRLIVFTLVGGLFGLAIWQAKNIGSELFPRADSGSFTMEMRLDPGLKVDLTADRVTEIEKKIREWIPQNELEMVIANTGILYGFPAAYTPNAGSQDSFMVVQLNENRTKTSQEYASILRKKMKETFPEVEVGFQLGGLLASAISGGIRAPLDIQISGKKIDESYAYAQKLQTLVQKIPGAVDVRLLQNMEVPQLNLEFDRDALAARSLSIGGTVKNLISAVVGSDAFRQTVWVDPKTGMDYLISVRFPPTSMSSRSALGDIPITSTRQERAIALSEATRFTEGKGASELNHYNIAPVIDVLLDTEGRSIGEVASDITRTIASNPPPVGATTLIRGEYGDMLKAVTSIGGGFLLAVFLVYAILVIQFRSYLEPVLILVSVPLGLIGVIAMFRLTGTYFSIQAATGTIFMVGIAVANGVILIETIKKKAEHATDPRDWRSRVIEGAQLRLRPIMMTSLASMFGVMPMAIGLGHGSEANIPLGRAVLGGQLASTVLTLFVLPAIYVAFKKMKGAKI